MGTFIPQYRARTGIAASYLRAGWTTDVRSGHPRAAAFRPSDLILLTLPDSGFLGGRSHAKKDFFAPGADSPQTQHFRSSLVMMLLHSIHRVLGMVH
jgi:hypothetical protein